MGADNYMWSNDYPHWESSWPRSREYIERNFQGVSEEIKRKVTWDNVTRLYDLDKKDSVLLVYYGLPLLMPCVAK